MRAQIGSAQAVDDNVARAPRRRGQTYFGRIREHLFHLGRQEADGFGHPARVKAGNFFLVVQVNHNKSLFISFFYYTTPAGRKKVNDHFFISIIDKYLK